MKKFEINERVYASCNFVYLFLKEHIVPFLPFVLYIGIAFAIVLTAGAVAVYIVNYPKVAFLIFSLILAVAFIAVVVVKYCAPKEPVDSDTNDTTKAPSC